MSGWKLHPEARVELHAALDYLDAVPDSAGLATRFADTVVQRIRAEAAAGVDRLPRYPDTAATYSRVPTFPYLLIFHQSAEDVVVIAIAHERKAPGYWADRLSG